VALDKVINKFLTKYCEN